MQNRYVKAVLFGALFFSAFLILPNPAHAATEVGGMLTESATWTMANSLYIVRADYFAHEWWTGCGEGYGLSLGTGVVLTIQPGVVVKFDVGTKFLSCQGQLIANGTAALPITFTANTDTPIPEYWQSMKLGPLDQVQHTHISYGSSCITYASSFTIFKFNTVESCGAALYFEAVRVPLIIEDNILQNSGYGIFMILSEGATISNNHFENNTGYGISINRPFSASTIENNEINGNWVGISFDYQDNSRISNNNITGNSLYGVLSRNTLNAQDNWWGDPTGPYNVTFNPGGQGNPVSNEVDFEPWLSEAVDLNQEPQGKRPVLIVPGVLGTEILKEDEKLWLDLGRNFTDIGDQFMDPLQFKADLTPSDTSLIKGDLLKNPMTGQHFYDLIIQEFQNQGYVEDTDLFLFPYDWRYGVNANIVDELKQKIQDIKTQTGSDEIDIIAHSTGGLLVKKYVMDNPVNNYIDKAVFVGVPNTGAPKAIKVLLQGDGFGIPWLADGEMKKIAKNLPVVYDLSPSQEYYNQKGSYVKIINQGFFSSTTQDLDFNQANNFLTTDHQLNSQAITNAQNLHTPNFDNFDLRTADVNLYSINGCKAGTIGKIVERRVKTILGGTNIGYDQPERVPGDGTVPLESATNLPIDSANKYYALQSDHGKMLSQDNIRQQIVNIISGSSLIVDDTKISKDISECKLNGKAISVFSPLDIDITDQDGNHAGLVSGGIENNIPNASFDIMGEHKFVYLPDDEGQTYEIEVNGTGNGTFTLKNEKITDNQIIQTEVFSDIPVTTNLTGNLNLGDSSTL